MVGNYVAAKVGYDALIKGWDNSSVFCIGRTNAPNLARANSDNKEVTVAVHIERPPYGRVGNEGRIHPGEPAIGGTAELATTVIIASGAPNLVLEPVTHAGRIVIDREPLLVTSCRRSKVGESLAAIEGPKHVVEECPQKAEIKKAPDIIAG